MRPMAIVVSAPDNALALGSERLMIRNSVFHLFRELFSTDKVDRRKNEARSTTVPDPL